MEIREMKKWIQACCTTKAWERKIAKMTDAEITALFRRLQKKGLIRV